MFTIIGQLVVGIILLAIVILILDCIRDLIGYIRGAFNYWHAGLYRLDSSGWTLTKVGFRKWLWTWRHGSGWYVEHNGMKYYENGKIEKDNFIPA